MGIQKCGTKERTDETHIEASEILKSTAKTICFKHLTLLHIGNRVSDGAKLLRLRAQGAKRLSRKLWMRQESHVRWIAKSLMTMEIIHLRRGKLLADSSLEGLSMARLLDLRVDLIRERRGRMARGDFVIRVRRLGSSRTRADRSTFSNGIHFGRHRAA